MREASHERCVEGRASTHRPACAYVQRVRVCRASARVVLSTQGRGRRGEDTPFHVGVERMLAFIFREERARGPSKCAAAAWSGGGRVRQTPPVHQGKREHLPTQNQHEIPHPSSDRAGPSARAGRSGGRPARANRARSANGPAPPPPPAQCTACGSHAPGAAPLLASSASASAPAAPRP